MPDNDTRSNASRLKRRDLLKAMAAVPAATLVPFGTASAMTHPPAVPSSAQAAGATAGVYQPKVLDPHEWKTVTVLSDFIIPADERSGSATQAKVPEFIDDWLGFRGGETLAAIRGGIIWLDLECQRQLTHDFVDCSEAERKQILDRIAYPKTAAAEDAVGVVFFNHLRDLVVSGFFSSEMGVKDLPYLGNQMVMDWEGCPPNVLAKLGFTSPDKKS